MAGEEEPASRRKTEGGKSLGPRTRKEAVAHVRNGMQGAVQSGRLTASGARATMRARADILGMSKEDKAAILEESFTWLQGFL